MFMLRALACIIVILSTLPVHAETARDILDRRKGLEDGPRKWSDRQYAMTLRITGRGTDRVRELVAYEKRLPDGERRSILFFRAPAEVNGTAFLSIAKGADPADQWIYMPELQRVRQVTTRGKNESFVGTDLTYGDLDIMQEVADWTEQDATATVRGSETLDGVPTTIIEFVPKRTGIAYKKLAVWFGVDDLEPRQIEAFGDDATPIKRLRQSAIRNIGPRPVAHTVEIETLAAGSRTTMSLVDVKFDQGLRDELFSQAALERGDR